MKRSFVFIPVMVLCVWLAASFASENVAKTEGKGLLRHVVCFKFKEDASQADVQKVIDTFGDLPNKIDEILDYEWGTNVSPEKLNKGFTHCFVLSFKTAKDRDIYLEHPAHKAFGKVLGPTINGREDVFVIDFWTK